MLVKLLVILLGVSTLASFQVSTDFQLPAGLQESFGENPLSLQDQNRVADLTTTVGASEWLGPLAPIAISPFFGITLLAAISQFGGDYLPVNSFISSNPVLSNPIILYVFLGLTILTSVPRFTKVSKPAGQAIDQLETYAGIITIIVIRFLPGFLESADPQPAMVLQMGFLSFSADLLLGVAAVINIIVINSVKFFFEVMVWLIPVPFIDAAMELTNKFLCVGLMAIYAWSPMAATIVNLVLFAICLVMFRWIKRRVTFLRAVIGDPIWRMISGSYGIPATDEVVTFAKLGFSGIPAKTKLILRPVENGWQLIQPRFLRTAKIVNLDAAANQVTMRNGFLINMIDIEGQTNGCLLFSSRYRNRYDELASRLNVTVSNEIAVDDLKVDLAKS